MLAAVFWLPVAASALGEEGIRVSPTTKVVENPFAASAGQASPSQAGIRESRTNVATQPPPPPPLPEAGPRMYQNPFAAQPSAPLEVMPIGPGPISRWRAPTEQPRTMIPDDRAGLPGDLIQRTPRPPGTVPDLAVLPAQPANPFSHDGAADDLSSAVLGGPGLPTPELVQPSWLLPDDGPGLLDAPATLLGPTRRDPFDATAGTRRPAMPGAGSDADQPADTVHFVPPDRDVVRAAAVQSAFDVDLSPVVTSGQPEHGRQDWLACAQQAARTADTPGKLSALVVLCRRGIAADVPRDERESLRQLAAWALNRRGEMASSAGRNEASLDDFQAAIDLDPRCWLALHNRAVSYAQQHRTSEALRDFNRVIELNPGLAVAYRNRGELLGSLGRTEEAVRDYTQAITQLPDDAELYLMRGHAWHRLGHYDRALKDLNRSIELAPDRADAYAHRGNVRAERGDFREAIADFRHALRLDPHSVEAYRSLAWLLATCPDPAVRDPQQAVSAARRAAELAPPDDCFVLDALAAAYASSGQFAKAVQYQQQALAAASEDYAAPLRQRLELYQQRQPYRNASASAVQPAAYEDSSPPPTPTAR